MTTLEHHVIAEERREAEQAVVRSTDTVKRHRQ
jgi:hypothetical protein